jgi:hypothetical protein
MKNIKHFNLFENSNETLAEIKRIVDSNQFIQDKNVTLEKIIESDSWIIYISQQTLDHIESHLKPSEELGDAPGSYYTKNWKKGVETIISKFEPETSDKPPYRTAWTGLDAGTNVGFVTIGYSKDVAEGNLDGFKKYTYDRPMRGQMIKETIVVKSEEASPTNYMTIVGSKIGEVNGKGLISLWTTYPDYKDGNINGMSIPNDRNEFEKAGFYFKCTPEFFNSIPMNESLKHIKSFDRF